MTVKINLEWQNSVIVLSDKKILTLNEASDYFFGIPKILVKVETQHWCNSMKRRYKDSDFSRIELAKFILIV